MIRYLLLVVFTTVVVAQYSPNGSGNNVDNTEWGSKGRPFYRIITEGDRISDISNLPNPRLVSNVVGSSNTELTNGYGVNLLESMFGQFINHDLQSTLRSPAPLILPLPSDDFLIGLPGTPQIGPNLYAIIVNNTVLNNLGEVINVQTSWLDLSTIYGTSNTDDLALRNSDGTLKMSSQYACAFPPPSFGALPCNESYRVSFNDLPPSTLQVPELGKPDVNFPPRADGTGVFNDADFRVNSNVALTLIHTLYKREHNRLVEKFRQEDSSLTGEELYQLAKSRNIAQYQQHVFYEYLPAIIPNIQNRLMRYSGYNASLVPDTSYEFDLGAFRYGHSAFTTYKVVDRCQNPLTVVPDWYLGINPYQDPQKFVFAGTSGPEPFLIPDVLSAARNEENVWYSLIYREGGKVDTLISNDLRNLGAGFFPIDLFAIDILRGRVANLSTYYEIRKKYYDMYNFGSSFNQAHIYGRLLCPLSFETSVDNDPLSCFSYITGDTELATKLKTLYGKVKNIDAVVGLLSEKISLGYRLPPTIAHIVFSEYNRKRLSDRFWFEDILSQREIRRLKSFKDVLALNFNVDRDLISRGAFYVPRRSPRNC
jgi:hypothetical protein